MDRKCLLPLLLLYPFGPCSCTIPRSTNQSVCPIAFRPVLFAFLVAPMSLDAWMVDGWSRSWGWGQAATMTAMVDGHTRAAAIMVTYNCSLPSHLSNPRFVASFHPNSLLSYTALSLSYTARLPSSPLRSCRHKQPDLSSSLLFSFSFSTFPVSSRSPVQLLYLLFCFPYPPHPMPATQRISHRNEPSTSLVLETRMYLKEEEIAYVRK